MTVEQKLDLIMRYIDANDAGERDELRREIHSIVNSEPRAADTDSTDINFLIEDILKELGIPAHILGYLYLVDAIQMVYDDPDIARAITKSLYVDVAKRHHTTGSRVERAIRHAIEVAFERGNYHAIEHIFGFSISANKGRATNSEFICAVTRELYRRNCGAR